MNIRAAFQSFIDTLRGRVINRTRLDSSRRTTLASLKPETIAGALSDATRGVLRAIADINDMMPALDPHVLGVRRQLRAGVQGIETNPIAIDESKEALAMVDACQKAMDRPGVPWSVLINGIIEGYLRGASLTEVMWEDTLPSPTAPRYWAGFALVPQQRLAYDVDSGELKLITDPAKPLESTPTCKLPVGKFVRCQVDEDIPDFSLRGTYRSILSDWFGRINVARWEQMAIERYGMPIPVGKYGSESARLTLTEAIESFGASGALVLDKDSSVEWGASTTKDLIHETYLEKSAERISVAFLGATQTVTIEKGSGSKASAGQHQGIRRDILFSIAELVAENIRRDLFIPFVRMNFGEAMVPFTPKLKAQFDEAIDLLTSAQAWAILKNELGYVVPIDYVDDITGITFTQGTPTPKMAPALPPAFGPRPVPALPAAPAAPGAPPAPAAQAIAAAVASAPPAFGSDVVAPLKRIVKTAPLSSLAEKVKNAPVPKFDQSIDLLAAEMLDATMKSIRKTREARGGAA